MMIKLRKNIFISILTLIFLCGLQTAKAGNWSFSSPNYINLELKDISGGVWDWQTGTTQAIPAGIIPVYGDGSAVTYNIDLWSLNYLWYDAQQPYYQSDGYTFGCGTNPCGITRGWTWEQNTSLVEFVEDATGNGLAGSIEITSGATSQLGLINTSAFVWSATFGFTGNLNVSGSGDFDTYTGWTHIQLVGSSNGVLYDAVVNQDSIGGSLSGDIVVSLPPNSTEILTLTSEYVSSAERIPDNWPPRAVAGVDQNVFVGSLVVLDANGSFDRDQHYPLTYSWILYPPSGTSSTAVLDDPSATYPTFTADVSGTYRATLVATDSLGVSGIVDLVNIVADGVLPQADLTLTMTDSPDPLKKGTELTYSLTVSNQGSIEATGISLSDVLPSGISFETVTTSQGSCAPQVQIIGKGRKNTVTTGVLCDLGSLAAGANATVIIVIRPQSTGDIINSASVSSVGEDMDLSNNAASVTTSVVKKVR